MFILRCVYLSDAYEGKYLIKILFKRLFDK